MAGAAMIFAILLRTGDMSTIFAIAGLLIISKLFYKWAEFMKDRSRSNLMDTMATSFHSAALRGIKEERHVPTEIHRQACSN